MDVDAYVAQHRAEWQRLEQLLSVVGQGRRRRRSASGVADDLVVLYQRTATHLSVLRAQGGDPALLARLSGLVARARGVVAGSRQAGWREVRDYLLVGFPALLYRSRRWWLAVAAGFLGVATALGAYVAGNPSVQTRLAPPEQIRQLVEQDFADYYSSAPAQDFAAHVVTNNALIAATCLAVGVLLLPVLAILLVNAVGVGVTGGFMVGAGRGDVFFGLILPHGLLELTAVFVAGGLGLMLGWTLVDPGPRSRGAALQEEGRAVVAAAGGLALVLLVSGVIEAFVTPSGLPTAARVGIGVLAETAFLGWVFVVGRRAHEAGERGDLDVALRGDVLPQAG